MQSDAVNDAENGSGGCDTERDGEDRGGGEPGGAAHEPDTVAEVLREDVEPAGAAGVAAFFLELGDATHGAKGGGAGFGRRQAGLPVALDLPIEVVAELLVELPIGVGAVDEGPETGAEKEEQAHGQASVRTRLMPAESRSQRARSSASFCRPGSVRE